VHSVVELCSIHIINASDVKILLNIFGKKWRSIRVFTQNKAKLCKILIITLIFEITVNFFAEIVENRRKLRS
jgi:hypothetical protein